VAGRVAVNGIVSAKKSVSVIKLFAGEHLEGRLAKKRVYAPAASGKANGHKGIMRRRHTLLLSNGPEEEKKQRKCKLPRSNALFLCVGIETAVHAG
jgi:hypothetical protein